MKTLFLSLVLVAQFAACSSVHAGLGQSEREFAARYGRPSREFDAFDREMPLVEGGVTHTYIHGDWRIRVGFVSHIAIREEFSKIPRKGKSLHIGDEDASLVFRGDAGGIGCVWQDKGNGFGGTELPFLMREFFADAWISRLWIRSDGNAAASMGHNRMRLRIDSVASLQYERFVDGPLVMSRD